MYLAVDTGGAAERCTNVPDHAEDEDEDSEMDDVLKDHKVKDEEVKYD